MNIFRTVLTTGFVVATLGAATVPAQASFAAVCSGSAVECIGQGQQKVGGDQNKVTLEDQIKTITNVLLFIIGAIAVIMIIIGGIRYVTSNGDASQTKAAKDTIMYAVIGIIVAILAYAIVNFVITAFAGK